MYNIQYTIYSSVSFSFTNLPTTANNCKCNNFQLLCIIINTTDWMADALRFGNINENCEMKFHFALLIHYGQQYLPLICGG